MPNTLVHAGYDVYLGDDLLKTKAHLTHIYNSATLRISGTAATPQALEFSQVEKVGDTRIGREHTLTFVGTDATGEQMKITAIRAGCNCGKKAR